MKVFLTLESYVHVGIKLNVASISRKSKSETVAHLHWIRNSRIFKHTTQQIEIKILVFTYIFSFNVVSNCPFMFHTNICPSFDPAAIRLISRLNETRDQSQPTLKLSLLQVEMRKKKINAHFIFIYWTVIESELPKRFDNLIHTEIEQFYGIVSHAAQQIFTIFR